MSRHSHDFTHDDRLRVVRILEYLNSTRDLGITYQRGSQERLVAYADDDYANSEERRSVTGRVLIFGRAVVVGYIDNPG